MLIAKQQLILIYPGQGCGKLCSSPVREVESESESMTGLEVKRKVEAGEEQQEDDSGEERRQAEE